MALFSQADLPVFEKKITENFTTAKELFKNKYYNASANRLYYSFVNLGCRNIAMYEDEIEPVCYVLDRDNTKIDKKKIKNCARMLRVKQSATFRIMMNQAESAREKADYSNIHVIPADIEDVFDKFEKILVEEGVINDQ